MDFTEEAFISPATDFTEIAYVSPPTHPYQGKYHYLSFSLVGIFLHYLSFFYRIFSFQASMNVVCVVPSVCNASYVPFIHLHICASSTFYSFDLTLPLSFTFPITYLNSLSLFCMVKKTLFFNRVPLMALLQFLVFYNVHVDQD